MLDGWSREPRILIIDDEEANVRVLERILAHAGLGGVATETDSRRAVSLVQSHAPDLVLLDLHMPGLDGFRVLEALRDRGAPDDYLPILVLTGDGQPTAKQQALAAGATD